MIVTNEKPIAAKIVRDRNGEHYLVAGGVTVNLRALKIGATPERRAAVDALVAAAGFSHTESAEGGA